MKSKTSLFKKGLIVSDLKRYWWVSAVFSLALVFSLPVVHYMQKFNIHGKKEQLEILQQSITRGLSFRSGISPLFPFVVPIVIAVLTYRYMQKGRSASLYHSLPVTRTALFMNSLVSSLILYCVPLLINVSVMLLLNCFSFLSAFYTAGLIFKWLGLSLLFGIMFMAMSIFAGMFTGSSIAQIAFIYILNLLPVFLTEVIRANLSEFLLGFVTYSNTYFYDRLPMMLLTNNRLELTPGITAAYIAVTLLLLAGGLIAFKLRRPETAGDIITFAPIKPVFIYGVTVCATLTGGAYFIAISQSYMPFVIFGYFISSLTGFIIAQMVANKSFNVIRTYKGYLPYALVLVIILMGLRFDAFGYVNRIPSPDQITEVYFGDNLYWWENKDNPDIYSRYTDIPEEMTLVLKDPENIKSITRLHKMALENRSKNGYSHCIAYKLKNGKKLIRQYNIDTDLYASALGPIYKSSEYMSHIYPVLHQNANDVKYIEIHDYKSNELPVVLSDKPQLDSFIKEIRKDVGSFSYQQLASNNGGIMEIVIKDTADKTTRYQINSDYINTLRFYNQIKPN